MDIEREDLEHNDEWYCDRCKKFPDKIEHCYQGQVVEIRFWLNGQWELDESNQEKLEIDYKCFYCSHRLEWKGEE